MTLRTFWQDFVDLIFPRCCEACDKPLVGNEAHICTACRILLPIIEKNSIHTEAVKYKFVNIPEVISTYSYLLFTKKGKVQKLLHALKYKGNQDVGILLGKMFGQEMIVQGTLPQAEMIVSVPLHKNKMAKRGYNQADLLAKGFSEATGIPWSGEILQRTKYTETQTGKSKIERQENVRGVFCVSGTFDKKSVIIMDDVLTTGATIEACVEALKPSGCEAFHILTIANAQH